MAQPIRAPMQKSSSSHRFAPDASAAPPYELTTSADDGGAGAAMPAQAPHQPHSSQQHQHSHKRKENNISSNEFDRMSCDLSLPGQPPQSPASSTRKRKVYSLGAASSYDEDYGDDARSTRTVSDKKQNHSEIEKRRRDKMNMYITELSAMIPMCGAMARKLDKLTVLRMAVQHLRSVRGALTAGPLTARPRPSFLTERELNALVLFAAQDCFLLVVGCDRGRLLYASASVEKMLHYDQSELLSQSLFDILHPKDVAKVKEQLSSSDLSPRERLIDAKTMLPVKADPVAGASRLCPGARRSFFCRIKCKNTLARVKEEDAGNIRKKNYCVVQCTGYLKLWAPTEMSEVVGGEGGEDSDGSLSCLVAVGRALSDLAPAAAPSACLPVHAIASAPPTRRIQFVSRYAIDGKFLFVDQRVTLALGFLPQELLGTSLYEYVGAPELGSVARAHKAALVSRDTLLTPPYGFRRKDGTRAWVQTHFKPFKNPWTKDVECLVANNTVHYDSNAAPALDADKPSCELYKHKPDLEMQRLIDSQVESHKIGSAIADEALRHCSPSFSPDLLQGAVFNEPATLVDGIHGEEVGGFVGELVRNNVSMSAACDGGPAVHAQEHAPPSVSPPLPSLGLDGNGEAAMAVIMSLLEADAGLGGPVNFSGLPWPLP